MKSALNKYYPLKGEDNQAKGFLYYARRVPSKYQQLQTPPTQSIPPITRDLTLLHGPTGLEIFFNINNQRF
jgi:hypothetical protein